MKTNRKMLYGAIVYCMIIGVIYVTLSVLALLTRWCMLDAKSSPFIYMLYLLYFRVDQCESNISWERLGVDDGPLVNVPTETVATKRAFVFSMSYLALHAALIATSLIALASIATSCVGRKSFVIFLAPWISLLIAIIVCDALASVYYIIDTVSAMKIDGLISLLEIVAVGEQEQEIRYLLGQISSFTRFGPPLLMALAASKMILFWVFNALWCVLIAKHGWSLATELDNEAKANYRNAIIANDNPAFEDENSHKTQSNPLARCSEIAQGKKSESPKNEHATTFEPPEQRYTDTSRSLDLVYPNQIYAKSKKQKKPAEEKEEEKYDQEQLDFKIQRPTLAVKRPVAKSSSPPPAFLPHRKDSETENRLNRFHESNGIAIKTAFAYESVPKSRESQYASVIHKETKSRPIPPPKPSGKYYLNTTGHESPVQYEAKVDRSSSGLKASEELRGQLPWSYFKTGENAPRRTLVHDESPELPMPDYNSPVNRQRKYSGSDIDDLWSFHRY